MFREQGHLRGCCLMLGCWGAVALWILPSGGCRAVSVLAFLVWQVLQVYCRVMLCATNFKPATRTKLVGKPSSCWDVSLQKHCHSDSPDNTLGSFFLHKLCFNHKNLSSFQPLFQSCILLFTLGLACLGTFLVLRLSHNFPICSQKSSSLQIIVTVLGSCSNKYALVYICV